MIYFFLIFLVIAFYRLGALDREIGKPLGFFTGLVVAYSVLFFGLGIMPFTLAIIGGFGALTLYKIIRAPSVHG